MVIATGVGNGREEIESSLTIQFAVGRKAPDIYSRTATPGLSTNTLKRELQRLEHTVGVQALACFLPSTLIRTKLKIDNCKMHIAN